MSEVPLPAAVDRRRPLRLTDGCRKLLARCSVGAPLPLSGNGPKRAADKLAALGLGTVAAERFTPNEMAFARLRADSALIVGGRRRLPVIDPAVLFWSKVAKAEGDGCWLWQAGLTRTGYGKFGVTLHGTNRQRHYIAHRYAWELTTGREPSEYLLHKCDTPRCVRPDHMFEGNAEDNAHDALKKGRWVGQRLTPDSVRQIRRMHGEGQHYTSVAALFGVAPSTAYGAATGRTWSWVT